MVHVSMTVPTEDLTQVRTLYPRLEEIGYDRAFSFEAKHDPFIPLAVAGEHTSTLQLGTAIAIGFARTPMTLANTAWDLQTVTGGRFALGLGSQIKPHIEQRFSMPWSRPVDRMRELVLGIRAIWQSWQDGTPLHFDGDFYTHTRMIPAFDPGPNPFGPPRILTAGFGPQHDLDRRGGGRRLPGASGQLPSFAVRADPPGAGPRARERADRSVDDIEVVCVTIVVTGRDEGELERSREAVRAQLAFYGTTPAYLPVFELHGYGDLHPELKRMARDNRWQEMAGLIDDELIATIAVVGEPHEIAPRIRERLAGISDSVSLVNNRAPDPEHFAEVVADLHAER
jgi:probable F420-dependent oxidoreductase